MSAIKYLSNVSKSMAYSAVDALKDVNPVFTSFAETNEEVTQTAYRSLRDFRMTSKKITKAVKDSNYTQLANKGFRNAWADLKTGQWYNRERIKAADNAAIDAMLGSDNIFGNYDEVDEDGGDGGDFGFDDSGSSDPFGGPDQGDEYLADNMDVVGERSSTAISTAVLKSAEIQTKSAEAMHTDNRVYNSLMFNHIRADMGSINENIANLVRFDTEVMQIHVQNSTEFYQNQTSLMTESRDLLKELVQLQKIESRSSDSSDSITLRDLFDSEGNINILNTGKFMKDKIMNGGTGMLGTIKEMADSGMLEGLVASPLSEITKTIMSKSIGPMLKQSFTDLNQSVSGIFSSFMMKASKWRDDDNMFKNAIGQLIGLDESVTSGYKVGDYDKGKTSWMGTDHKSLTEVIPTLLASIDARLGGENKRFDYNSGKFVTVKDIKKKYDKMYESAGLQSGSNMYYKYLSPAIQDTTFETVADRDAFEEAISKILQYNFKNTTTFDPSSNHSASTYGINIGSEEENEAFMKRIEQLWSTAVPKSEQMAYNTELINAMTQFNEQMKELERGGSIFDNIFNNSDMDITPINVAASAPAAAAGPHQSITHSIILGDDGNVLSSQEHPVPFSNIRNTVNDVTGSNSNTTASAFNNAALEQIKIDHPEYFEYKNGDQILKSGYEFKNGEVVRKVSKLKTGIRVIDELTGADRTEMDGDQSDVRALTISERLDKIESPLSNFITKLSDTIYDKFFPRDSETDKESDMTFAQKISYGVSDALEKTNESLSKAMDSLQGKFTGDNFKKFLKEWFNIDTDKISTYFHDVLLGNSSSDKGVFGGFIDNLKIGFKGLGKWLKGSAKDVSDWVGNDDEMIALNKRRSRTKNRLQELFSEDVPEDEGRYDNPFGTGEGREVSGSGSGIISANDIMGTHAAASEGGVVRETGLHMVSKGETIISKDMTPQAISDRMRSEIKAYQKKNKMSYNKASEKVYSDTWNSLISNKSYDAISDLTEINPKFVKWIRKDKVRVKQLSDIAKGIDPTISFKDQFKNYGSKVLSNAKNLGNFAKDSVTDIVDEVKGNSGKSEEQIAKEKEAFTKSVQTVESGIKENFPNFITGTVVGGGVSLLTGVVGGPLLGAAAGVAVSLLSSSESVRQLVFGDIDATGERTGGLLPAQVSNIITKYAPNMAKGATLGAITSILPFVPGGPVAGILIGSSLGFLTKSESVQESLFGLFGDNISAKDVQKKIQSVLPKMGLGAISGVALGGILGGPFGIAGNALLGSALGFASDTNKFKDLVFGTVGEDGKREGGLLKTFENFLKDTIAKPLKDLASPLKVQVKNMFKSIGNSITGIFKSIGNTIATRLKKSWIGEKLLSPMGKAATSVLGAPFKMFKGGVGSLEKGLRKHQLKVGTAYQASDMATAQQRNEYRAKYGMDENNSSGFITDQTLAKSTYKDLDALSASKDLAMSLHDTKDYVKTGLLGQNKDITKKLNKNKKLTDKMKKDIKKFVMDGQYDRVSEYISATGTFLTDAEKEDLLLDVTDIAKKVNTFKGIGDNMDEYRSSAIQKLKDAGLEVNGKMTYEDLAKEIDQQSKFINDNKDLAQETQVNIDDNTKQAVDLLTDIKDLITGITTPETFKDLEETATDTSSPLSAKYKFNRTKRNTKDAVLNNKTDLTQEWNRDQIKESLITQGYSEEDAEKYLDKLQKRKEKGSIPTRGLKAVLVTPGAILKGAKNLKQDFNNSAYDNAAISADMSGVTDNIDKANNPSRVSKSTIKYSYNSEGMPIRIKVNSKGEETVDTQDSNTDKNIEQEQQNKLAANSGLINGITSGLKGIFSKSKDDEEDDEPGFLSSILDALTGGAGILSSIASGLGPLLISAIPLALSGFALSGKFDNAVNKLSGGEFGKEHSNKVVTDSSGKIHQLELDEKGNPVTDENGNYIDSTGELLDSNNSYVQDTDSTATSSLSDRLKGNLVRGTITGKGSIVGSVLKKNTIVKSAGKAISTGGNLIKSAGSAIKGSNVALDTADSFINSLDDVARVEAGGKITTLVSTFVTKLHKVPFVGKLADGLGNLAGQFSEFVLKHVPKAGSALKSLSSTLSKIAIPLTVALAIADFVSGWQDANATLKISGECTTGQKIYCGLLRALKNLIPVVGTFIPDATLSKFLVGIVGPIFGINKDELLQQQESAQAEVDQYNSENGTDYDFEEYNKAVLGNYTTGEKIKNAATSFVDNVKEKGLKDTVVSGAQSALGAAKNSVVDMATALSDKAEDMGISFKDIGKNASAVWKMVKAGDIGGLWATAATSDDGPAGNIEKAVLFSNKLMATVPTLISAVGGKFAKFMDPIASRVKMTLDTGLSLAKLTVGKTIEGDIKGLWEIQDSGDDGTPVTGFSKLALFGQKFALTPITLVSGAAHLLWNGVKGIFSAVNNTVTDVIDTAATAGSYMIKGDIKGLWTDSGLEDDGTNPIFGIAQSVSLGSKLILTVPTLISGAGHSIWNTVKPILDPATECGKKFTDFAAKLKAKSDKADIIGIINEKFDPGTDGVLGGVFSAVAGIQKVFYTVVSLFNAGGAGFDIVTDAIANSPLVQAIKNFFGTDEQVAEYEDPKKETKESGSGSKITGLGSGFISQVDPRYSNTQFNISGDSRKQTLGDTGCAPASAAMAINLAGRGADMMGAAKDALSYKVNNDGVTPDYFADEFSKHGIGSAYTNSAGDIKSALSENNPVVLMGKDSSNKSKKNSPFGSGNHYVTATGMSGDTMYINDPEASRGNIPYKASKILNHTKLGIAALGSGNGSNVYNMRNILKGYNGKGTYSEDSVEYKVWTRMIGAGYSEYAVAGAMGNIARESGFNPAVIEKGSGSGFGLCQWSFGRRTQLEAFAKARNASPADIDLQIDFMLAELDPSKRDPNASYQLIKTTVNGQECSADAWKNAKDLTTATTAFCFSFERPSYEKAGLDVRINAAKEYYQAFTGTPGVVGDGTYSQSAESYTSSTTDSDSSNSGGILSKLSSAIGKMAAAFGLGDDTDSSTTADSDTTDGTYSSTDSTTGTNSTYATGLDVTGISGKVSADPQMAIKQKKLVAAMKSVEGKLNYKMAGGNRDPEKGDADCSSTVAWAYKKVLGVDPGTNTEAQRTDEDTYTVSNNIDENNLQLGDLLLRNGHVEMYEGNGKMIGHGGPNWGDLGPTEKPLGRHPNGKPFNLVRRWNGFKDTGTVASDQHVNSSLSASGSGIDDQSTLNRTSPINYSNASNRQHPVNTTYGSSTPAQTQAHTTVPNNSGIIDILKILVQSVGQIANNTSAISQVVAILTQLSNLSIGTGNGNDQAILNNSKEIANIKSALVSTLTKSAKDSNNTDIQNLINSVESLTVQ